MIKELQKKVYANAKNKGFHEGEKNTGEMLALIHSEVSEALEADRKDNYFKGYQYPLSNLIHLPDTTFAVQFRHDVKDTFEDELADVMIR
jgi:NTP pyrophosphatase (non-canonical NTP hydrolase)